MAESNSGSENDALFTRAQNSIPGGVNSPVRAFGSVGGSPYFVARAEGAYVWDVAGRKYLDYVQSWGASILGHAHPKVIAAITEAAQRGTSYGAPTENEVLLAEAIKTRVPGCDLVRLVASGTEATMSAIRVARGFTGRDRIVKFDGCYHGHSDSLLVAAGSGVATLSLPDSSGVPVDSVKNTRVVSYNVVPELDEQTACVIVEPVAANMGLVPPVPGFLEGLRAECDRVGALLIFDEVITGFRITPGSVASVAGVQPDLWCFGKVIGGGLPVGAFGGRESVMSMLAPLGPVYQAGTLSGNPLATAAGLAALDCLDEQAYVMLKGRADEVAALLGKAMAEAGVESQVVQYGPLLGLFFGAESVTDYDGAKKSAATGKYSPFFHAMLERSVALPPSPYEVFFPSLAHSWDDIERTGDALFAAANAIGA